MKMQEIIAATENSPLRGNGAPLARVPLLPCMDETLAPVTSRESVSRQAMAPTRSVAQILELFRPDESRAVH